MGELLSVAEGSGFGLFITADQSISYQQNLKSRKIAIIELTKNNWPSIANHVVEIADAADAAAPGSYRVVACKYVYTRRKKTL